MWFTSNVGAWFYDRPLEEDLIPSTATIYRNEA